MKKIILTGLIAFSVLAVSCNSSKKDGAEDLDTVNPTPIEAVDMHNAETSLDIAGTYKGVLPCADCEGIQTSIALNPDNTYELTTVYLKGKAAEDQFVEKGVWTIQVNTLTLKNADKSAEPNNTYFVGENTLTQLDVDGNKIEGALAEYYILRK